MNDFLQRIRPGLNHQMEQEPRLPMNQEINEDHFGENPRKVAHEIWNEHEGDYSKRMSTFMFKNCVRNAVRESFEGIYDMPCNISEILKELICFNLDQLVILRFVQDHLEEDIAFFHKNFNYSRIIINLLICLEFSPVLRFDTVLLLKVFKQLEILSPVYLPVTMDRVYRSIINRPKSIHYKMACIDYLVMFPDKFKNKMLHFFTKLQIVKKKSSLRYYLMLKELEETQKFDPSILPKIENRYTELLRIPRYYSFRCEEVKCLIRMITVIKEKNFASPEEIRSSVARMIDMIFKVSKKKVSLVELLNFLDVIDWEEDFVQIIGDKYFSSIMDIYTQSDYGEFLEFSKIPRIIRDVKKPVKINRIFHALFNDFGCICE